MSRAFLSGDAPLWTLASVPLLLGEPGPAHSQFHGSAREPHLRLQWVDAPASRPVFERVAASEEEWLALVHARTFVLASASAALRSGSNLPDAPCCAALPPASPSLAALLLLTHTRLALRPSTATLATRIAAATGAIVGTATATESSTLPGDAVADSTASTVSTASTHRSFAPTERMLTVASAAASQLAAGAAARRAFVFGALGCGWGCDTLAPDATAAALPLTFLLPPACPLPVPADTTLNPAPPLTVPVLSELPLAPLLLAAVGALAHAAAAAATSAAAGAGVTWLSESLFQSAHWPALLDAAVMASQAAPMSAAAAATARAARAQMRLRDRAVASQLTALAAAHSASNASTADWLLAAPDWARSEALARAGAGVSACALAADSAAKWSIYWYVRADAATAASLATTQSPNVNAGDGASAAKPEAPGTVGVVTVCTESAVAAEAETLAAVPFRAGPLTCACVYHSAAYNTDSASDALQQKPGLIPSAPRLRCVSPVLPQSSLFLSETRTMLAAYWPCTDAPLLSSVTVTQSAPYAATATASAAAALLVLLTPHPGWARRLAAAAAATTAMEGERGCNRRRERQRWRLANILAAPGTAAAERKALGGADISDIDANDAESDDENGARYGIDTVGAENDGERASLVGAMTELGREALYRITHASSLAAAAALAEAAAEVTASDTAAARSYGVSLSLRPPSEQWELTSIAPPLPQSSPTQPPPPSLVAAETTRAVALRLLCRLAQHARARAAALEGSTPHKTIDARSAALDAAARCERSAATARALALGAWALLLPPLALAYAGADADADPAAAAAGVGAGGGSPAADSVVTARFGDFKDNSAPNSGSIRVTGTVPMPAGSMRVELDPVSLARAATAADASAAGGLSPAATVALTAALGAAVPLAVATITTVSTDTLPLSGAAYSGPGVTIAVQQQPPRTAVRHTVTLSAWGRCASAPVPALSASSLLRGGMLDLAVTLLAVNPSPAPLAAALSPAAAASQWSEYVGTDLCGVLASHLAWGVVERLVRARPMDVRVRVRKAPAPASPARAAARALLRGLDEAAVLHDRLRSGARDRQGGKARRGRDDLDGRCDGESDDQAGDEGEVIDLRLAPELEADLWSGMDTRAATASSTSAASSSNSERSNVGHIDAGAPPSGSLMARLAHKSYLATLLGRLSNARPRAPFFGVSHLSLELFGSDQAMWSLAPALAACVHAHSHGHVHGDGDSEGAPRGRVLLIAPTGLGAALLANASADIAPQDSNGTATTDGSAGPRLAVGVRGAEAVLAATASALTPPTFTTQYTAESGASTVCTFPSAEVLVLSALTYAPRPTTAAVAGVAPVVTEAITAAGRVGGAWDAEALPSHALRRLWTYTRCLATLTAASQPRASAGVMRARVFVQCDLRPLWAAADAHARRSRRFSSKCLKQVSTASTDFNAGATEPASAAAVAQAGFAPTSTLQAFLAAWTEKLAAAERREARRAHRTRMLTQKLRLAGEYSLRSASAAASAALSAVSMSDDEAEACDTANVTMADAVVSAEGSDEDEDEDELDFEFPLSAAQQARFNGQGQTGGDDDYGQDDWAGTGYYAPLAPSLVEPFAAGDATATGNPTETKAVAALNVPRSRPVHVPTQARALRLLCLTTPPPWRPLPHAVAASPAAGERGTLTVDAVLRVSWLPPLPWLPVGPRPVTVADLAAAAEEAVRFTPPEPATAPSVNDDASSTEKAAEAARLGLALSNAASSAATAAAVTAASQLETALLQAFSLHHAAYVRNKDDRSGLATQMLLSLYQHAIGRKGTN